MPSKREHSKSRLGCSQCKRRHIKCDQVTPRCGPCNKKGIECDYQNLETGPYTKVQILTPENFASSLAKSGNRSAEYAASRRVDDSARTSNGFSSDDLILMHHYTLHTSQTIAKFDDDEYHEIWQKFVPQLASRHLSLMHAILSVTAAHMAVLEPGREGLDFAASRRHFSKALELFTATVDSITADRADAVLCFCILVMVISFALETRESIDKDNPHTGVVSIFGSIRTAISMLEPYRKELQEREVGRLLRHLDERKPHNTPAEVEASVHCLHQAISAQSKLFRPDEVEVLHDAAKKIRQFYTFVDVRPKNWAHVLQWPISVAPGYLELLRQDNPAALAIFSHWCVALHHAPKYWCIGSWPKQAILAISQELDRMVWQEALAWPNFQVTD